MYSLLLLIHFCTPFEIHVFHAMDFFNTSVWGDAIASVVTVVKGPKKSPICPLDGAHGLIYFEFSSRWWLLSTVSLPYLTLPNAARCVPLVKREWYLRVWVCQPDCVWEESVLVRWSQQWSQLESVWSRKKECVCLDSLGCVSVLSENRRLVR